MEREVARFLATGESDPLGSAFSGRHSGLTIICGGNSGLRTFVVYALEDSTREGDNLRGLDAHEANWFVPLPGVFYCAQLSVPGEANSHFMERWNEITRDSRGPILLNGVWRALDFSS